MQKRIESLDIAKGIGIVLVVIGHLIPVESILRYWIASFHMPLFFIISGYCYTHRDIGFGSFAIKRARQLMIPCFWFTLLNIAYDVSTKGLYVLSTLLWNLPLALWFLPVLFLATLMYYPIGKIRYPYIKLGLSVAALFLAYLCNIYIGYIPHSLKTVFLAVFFYGIGNVCKEVNLYCPQSQKLTLAKSVLSMIVLCIPFAMQWGGQKHYIAMVSNSFDAISVIVSIIMTYAMIVFSSCIVNARIKSVGLWLGRNSIVILGLHFVFAMIAVDCLKPFIGSQLLFKIFQISFVGIMCYISILLIKRKAPFIIGK